MMYSFLVTKIEIMTVPMIVWTVYIGIAIGVIMTYYNKSVLGKAIRALLEKEAFGEEKALTAEALGFAGNRVILNSIRRGALARFVHTVGEEEKRYYLVEDERHRAELRYSNKGTDLYVVIVSLVIFLLVAFVAARYLTDWISAAGDIIS
ncbi:MAG: hypothetical protein IJD35_02390 [Clostridia bacterium]|nr:hypothetical protein [Clostridia bacterium]